MLRGGNITVARGAHLQRLGDPSGFGYWTNRTQPRTFAGAWGDACCADGDAGTATARAAELFRLGEL